MYSSPSSAFLFRSFLFILQICICQLYDDEVRGDEDDDDDGDDDDDDAAVDDDGGRDDVVFCLYYRFAFVNCMMMKCVVMMMTKTTTTMMMMIVTTMVVLTGDVRLHIIILHAGEREANCDDTLKPSAWSLCTLQAMQATPSFLSAER